MYRIINLGMKNLNGNIDNDSNNDNDDDETRHTLRFYPQSLALLPQPPPPSRPHPGQAFHQSQIHDSQMMIQMPSNVQLIQNSQALLSKVTTLPQSPYQVRVPSPFQQQQEILLQQPQMQHHHHHHQQQGQQQQQSQMQQRLFGSPW